VNSNWLHLWLHTLVTFGLKWLSVHGDVVGAIQLNKAVNYHFLTPMTLLTLSVTPYVNSGSFRGLL